MSSPRFTPSDRPSDILAATGHWLAGEVDGRWVKSRNTLVLHAERRRFELHLQSSVFSRGGMATWVSPRVMIFDQSVVDWRNAHPDKTVFSKKPSLAWVYNTLLVNVEPGMATVECSGLPNPVHAANLDELLQGLQNRILPVFDLFRSPHLLSSGLPDSCLSMVDCSTIEWALAHADPASASLLIRRHMELPLRGMQRWQGLIDRFREGWETAPDRSALPQVLYYATEPLGWWARVHDLLDPMTLQEPEGEERRFVHEPW